MQLALQNLLLNIIGQKTYDLLALTPQPAKQHAEGSVLNHTLLVMEEVAKYDFKNAADYQLMMAAAITHDLGKIDATEIHPDGKITSYGHENKSYKYIIELQGPLYFYFPDASLITLCTITSNHMRAHLYKSGKMSNPNKRRAFETDTFFDEIMLFASFDSQGRINGV